MSTHKHIDKICCVVLALTLILTIVFMNGEHLGIQKASYVADYEKTLFDNSKVHTVNIIMDDWDDFIENCKNEEYYDCSVVIDNEAFKNVAIRGKGNTSLSSVDSYGNDRYSFKIEFDHYDSTNTYYGLDKLCLNNIIQDNTYIKDYLTYTMMNEMGVASPLCSFVYITVNGEDWGLYLAAESVEDSFLKRNYGKDYGELYKPDSMNMGGGRGNGKEFDIDEFVAEHDKESATTEKNNSKEKQTENNTNVETISANVSQLAVSPPDFGGQGGGMPGGFGGEMPEGFDGQFPGGFGGEMPEGFDGQMPEGMTPPTEERPDTSEETTIVDDKNSEENKDKGEKNESSDNRSPGGFGGFGGMGKDDVLLKYIDDDFDSYSNIFDSAKTEITKADKTRLIEALKKLSNGEDLENTVDVEAVIRYFVVHNFVLNFDSYTGSMIHNYYLYEKDGQLQMIPWDYNLAFGSFMSMGSAESLINYPIDSPVSGGNAEDRPMIAWIFANEEYTELYHKYFSEFISEYFDSGYFEKMIDDVKAMISPYVEKDPTKFCTFEEFEKGIDTLKEVCILRAESISGQLDGTIGSTTDTQKEETLIDAGDIQISDMGSMGGFGRKNSSGKDRNETDSAENNKNSAESENGEDEQSSDDNNGSFAQPPDNFGGMQMPEDFNFEDSGNMQPPDGEFNPEDFGNMQPPEGFDGEMPDFFGGKQDGEAKDDNVEQRRAPTQTVMSAASWIAIGVSVLVLALGLCFAILFKRRK